ncbi:MAG: cation-translocating P-type ATPase [Reyranella sp.]|uniref:cation-translocating P-type ATPase n=1 Tax=Reyranella sp. TaxID=1929291 RepID=UPI003D0D8603
MKRVFQIDRVAGLSDADRGLTSLEVEERRRLYGANDILRDQRSGWADIVHDTARDPMLWFLVATALLFAALGDYTEAVVLGLALLPIAGMDAYLHRRTRATAEGLAGRLASTAQVLREGVVAKIAAIDIVPGDLAIVPAGEPFPADGFIVAGANLQADESALTGEAMPVRKHPYRWPTAEQGEVTVDGEFCGAAGTRLLTGEARLRIISTGSETLYGEIVRSAREGQHEKTPLQDAIKNLVTVLVVAALVVCVALAATRLYQGFGIVDAFMSAVTLAVAALPEEFPVVFAVFLGVGVYRLARRQALVRRSVVVENIGRITCICSDKTGTITEGRLRLTHLLPADGHAPDELRRVAAIASRAESGDPMDMTILGGIRLQPGERLATFPFTEDRRREVGAVREDSGTVVIAAKGAPETILGMSKVSRAERTAWIKKTEELAAGGHKVIAGAYRRFVQWSGGEPEQGYCFAGLLAFEDPVREGVREAVAKARAVGIRVIMVTGDHVATARAIAREAGIGGDSPVVIEGTDLAGRLSRHGQRGIQELDAVARAMPSQKLDLVRALKSYGEIVAVTGDGVNDVPALQGADVGIAMGERGTRTAREVASIVLLDDNFRTIVRAIAEGRQLFHNLKLSFAFLLMVHIPLVGTAALIPFAGFPLLYLPLHIVWLELIIHPVALLVFQELPASDELESIQRHLKVRFFDWREWTLIAIVGSVVGVIVVGGYVRSLGVAHDVEHARTMALVALVLATAAITAGLSRLRSRSAIAAVLITVASAVILSQTASIAALLHLRPLHWDDWFLAGCSGLLAGSLAILLPSIKRKQRTGTGHR